MTLPVELWDRILSFVGEDDRRAPTLRTLALVCKRSAASAQRLLFFEPPRLSCYARPDDEGTFTHGGSKSVAALLRVGGLIHTLTVNIHPVRPDEPDNQVIDPSRLAGAISRVHRMHVVIIMPDHPWRLPFAAIAPWMCAFSSLKALCLEKVHLAVSELAT
jgi:hypothetical protein